VLADLGVSTEMRAAILGHGKAVNLDTYTHSGMEAKRGAMDKLGRHLFAVSEAVAG
jgi:hypothetical protein